MNAAAATIGEIAWVLGIIAWYVIRYPFERRAKRRRVASNRRSSLDTFGLGVALLGMAILPALYVAAGVPGGADHGTNAGVVALGIAVFAAALWLFRVSHKQLGRNWSISLEIREKHALIHTGPYRLIRHPMYASFLLMSLGQALLVPNWVAGLAGLVGSATLFALRVDKEEGMMIETFGEEYRAYMTRTKRIIPYLY